MTDTIAPAPSPGVANGVEVRIEEDAFPLVRLIGRALRNSARAGHALPALQGLSAAVTLRSHDTPQVATIAFASGVITVTSGSAGATDATITADLNARFAPAGEAEGDADTVAAVLDALNPPVPDWREAAETFWAATRSIRGIPDVLIAIAADEEGDIEQHVVGEGDSQYLMASSPEALAGIFSGADDLIAVLSTGVLGLKGTMSQLSVMVGASWKVRFDV